MTRISHGFTCVVHPDPPSRLPLHPIPLGLPSAPALSTCLMHMMNFKCKSKHQSSGYADHFRTPTLHKICLSPLGFPDSSAGKESTCNAVDARGRPPGEGKGYPLQNSSLENSMECIGHGVAKSQAQLSDFHFGTEGNSLECWSQDFATVQPSPRTSLPPGEEKYKSSDASPLFCSFCSYDVLMSF